MGIITRLYEWRLKSKIRQKNVPLHIVLALSESDLLADTGYIKLNSFLGWCKEMGMRKVTVYISIIEVDEFISKKICGKLSSEMLPLLMKITPNVNVITRGDKEIRKYETEDMVIDISLGYSGKFELTKAMKEIMLQVKKGTSIQRI